MLTLTISFSGGLWLLTDEEGHINFLETQLQLLNTIGLEKYVEFNSPGADEAE